MGVAICSRLPLKDIRLGFGDAELDQQRRIVSARVGDVWLVNVYAPHGEKRGEDKYFYKLEFLPEAGGISAAGLLSG